MSTALSIALTTVLVALVVLDRPVLHRPVPRQGRAGRALDARASGPVERSVAVPDVVLVDLVVAALGAGLPPASAVAAARAAAAGSAPAEPNGAPRGLPLAVVQAFELAERTGASAAELMRRAAADERAARRAAVAVAASRLGVRLVIPLGLAVLPAFVLLGVVPVVIGLAQPLLSP